ncbi:MAG: hypothetical protein WB760_33125, partial [Xanthobacteraceae bacterium]
GIGYSLVARVTDQLIRLSTGACSTPPSPAVRNHRIAVRLALDWVSALHRISHCDSPKDSDADQREPQIERVHMLSLHSALRMTFTAILAGFGIGTMFGFMLGLKSARRLWPRLRDAP